MSPTAMRLDKMIPGGVELLPRFDRRILLVAPDLGDAARGISREIISARFHDGRSKKALKSLH